jgi:hypothetical protein
MQRTYDLKLYIVVEVWRGIAASAKNFTRMKDAQSHLRRIRRRRNLAEDDFQLFESSVRISL